MKTTIELPDELFQQAKVMAAERGMTLKDIMVQSLKLWFRTPAEDVEKKRQATVKRLLQAMRASNTEPMIPLKREEIYDR
jgi:predicted transcriptional regulator